MLEKDSVLSKFDPMATVEPKTQEDYIRLLNEAIAELKILHENLCKIFPDQDSDKIQ
jgi:hypothetical protein